MLDHIFKIVLVFFGLIVGFLIGMPLVFSAMQDESHYMPFGIGIVLGLIAAALATYAHFKG